MRITTKERELLVAIRDDQYHDGRHPLGDPVWTWSVMESAGLGDGGGGVMASLVKKGLAIVDDSGRDDDHTVALTLAGFEAISND